MIDLFQNGQQGSKSALMTALTALITQGNDIINSLVTSRQVSLIELDNRQAAILGRHVLANRVMSPTQAIKFVVSDFSDIDQANTTATVRADSAVVSLKERNIPVEAVIQSTHFSANQGTLEALNAAQTLVTVNIPDGVIPIGQFDITLIEALTLNQINIGIIPSPSSPTIVVSVSGDGLVYTSATNVVISGSQITVWLESIETKYIRVQITPTLPDNLNGDSYTFGITGLYAQATTFQLRSDLVTKTISFIPNSATIVLDAPSDPNIQYYVAVTSAGGTPGSFVEMSPGDTISIGTSVTEEVVTSPSIPDVLAQAPSDLYLSTISVTENGVPLNIAVGLSPTDPNVEDLENEYVVVVEDSVGYTIQLLSGNGEYNPPRTFVVSYVYGPSLVNVQFKARLSTNDSSISPVFQGASLDSE